MSYNNSSTGSQSNLEDPNPPPLPPLPPSPYSSINRPQLSNSNLSAMPSQSQTVNSATHSFSSSAHTSTSENKISKFYTHSQLYPDALLQSQSQNLMHKSFTFTPPNSGNARLVSDISLGNGGMQSSGPNESVTSRTSAMNSMSSNQDTLNHPGLKFPYREQIEHSISEECATQNLEVTPITLYQSVRGHETGKLVSVNNQFISYPIRNGLIRVISQTSVDRCLLRRHENHQVVDLAFFQPQSNLLCSTATDNKIIIWDMQPDPLTFTVNKVIACETRLIKWHPQSSDKIGAADGSKVYVINLKSFSSSGSDSDNISESSITCTQPDGVMHDFTFSMDGECVITAGSDGLVRIFRVGGLLDNQNGHFVHQFEPFNGKAVTSVFFHHSEPYKPATLVLGGDGNRQIAFWNAALTESMQPACDQTIKLRSSQDADASDTISNELLLDSTSGLLFVASRKKPILTVFHIGSTMIRGGMVRYIDSATEFTLAYPILSMEVHHPQESLTSSPDQANMHLYCVQTEAIQRYNISLSACYSQNLESQSEVESMREESTTQEPLLDNVLGQTVGSVTREDALSYQPTSESSHSSTRLSYSYDTNDQIGVNADTMTDAERLADNDGSLITSTTPPRLVTTPPNPRLLPTIPSTSGSEHGSCRSLTYPRLPHHITDSSPTSSGKAIHEDTSSQLGASIDDFGGDTQQILTYLKMMEAKQTQRDQNLLHQQQILIDRLGKTLETRIGTQIERTLQRQVQSILVPAMGRIVMHTMEHSFKEPVCKSFQSSISDTLLPKMEAKLNHTVATAVPGQVDKGMKSMVGKLVEDVRQPIRNSFRECFQDIIIPSFQAATQKMFEQISDTFVKGAQSAVESSTQGVQSLQSIQLELQHLRESVDSLGNKLNDLDASNSVTVKVDSAVQGPEENYLDKLKEEVTQFLQNEDYEQAFQMVGNLCFD